MDEVFCHNWDTSVHLGELNLSSWQTLFGGSQQPFHGLGSVALDGIAIVIQTTVVEDAKIKLRRGVAAVGGSNEVLDGATLHQSIQSTERERDCSLDSSSALARRLSSRDLGIMRGSIRPSIAASFCMGLK